MRRCGLGDRRRCERERRGRRRARLRHRRHPPPLDVPALLLVSRNAQPRRVQREAADDGAACSGVDGRVDELDAIGREFRRLRVTEPQRVDSHALRLDLQLRRGTAGQPVGPPLRHRARRRAEAQARPQIRGSQSEGHGIDLGLDLGAGRVALPREREAPLPRRTGERAGAFEDDGCVERPLDRLRVEREGIDGERGGRCHGSVAPVEPAGF